MKKILLTCALMLGAMTGFAQMSDTQVMQYVQREMNAGASQSQIATRPKSTSNRSVGSP